MTTDNKTYRHRLFWRSVACVSVACICWAFLLLPSPINDFYRYGYGISGAFCLLAVIAENARRPTASAILLVIGSIAYVGIPARTFTRLLLSGDLSLLIQTDVAAVGVPNSSHFPALEAFYWYVDLAVFQTIFALYFSAVLLLVGGKAAMRFFMPRRT